VGKTYELELHRPREDRMPFICHLTFQAGGDDLGDLVQVLATLIHDINLPVASFPSILHIPDRFQGTPTVLSTSIGLKLSVC